MTRKRLKTLILFFLSLAIVAAVVFLVVRIRHVREYRAEVLRTEMPDYDELLSFDGYIFILSDYYRNRRNLLPGEEKDEGDYLAAYMEDAFFYRAFSENGMEEKAAARKAAMEHHLSLAGDYGQHAEKIMELMNRR